MATTTMGQTSTPMAKKTFYWLIAAAVIVVLALAWAVSTSQRSAVDYRTTPAVNGDATDMNTAPATPAPNNSMTPDDTTTTAPSDTTAPVGR